MLGRVTVIVGGGLAGLSCARELGLRGKPFVLLEAEERLGGLCRTDVVEGFSFDWTGHWLHARDPDMRALILGRWLAGNVLEVERRARVFSSGTWTGYPFQVHTHGLPPAVIAECVLGFVEATVGPAGAALRAREPQNAAEFVLRHLGAGFARHFMTPYNAKLFTVPPEELAAEWAGRFLPRPTLEDVVRGSVGAACPPGPPAVAEPGAAGYNARFWYPRTGGIEALGRGLAAEVRGLHMGTLRTNARAARIDLAARAVVLAGGEEIPFSELVLTLPLPAAVRALGPAAPPAVLDAAGRLRAVQVTVVEVGAVDVGGPRFHWAYFPEARFPFYRVGSPSEVNPALAPAGHRSFAVEFSHRGPAGPSTLIAQALAGLRACGLIGPGDDLLRVVRARTIPVAYALFDHAYAAARTQVREHFARHDVELAGRYGLWEYSSMEDALLSGRAAAARIVARRA